MQGLMGTVIRAWSSGLNYFSYVSNTVNTLKCCILLAYNVMARFRYMAKMVTLWYNIQGKKNQAHR